MACPRCGCRMVSKAGSGADQRLICSDCGHPLSSLSQPAEKTLSKRSQLITVMLIAVFGSTAGLLMTLKDHQSPSLIEAKTLNFNQPHDSRNDQSLRRLNRVLQGVRLSGR
ncbi:MAG: hypothetical protein FJ051_06535 [Cyanobacteria bacterium M_surface_9_m1_291]|nr:hypothetical protein [Cyanobacteria bacterium K_Offshore_0m_m2_072]MBM5809458.1 hypothetical protein [Cyanobacteria bacterium M_surface_9_m1_291]